MALQKTVTLTDNFGQQRSFANAYIKVSQVSGGKQSMMATVETRTSDKSHALSVENYQFVPDLDGENFIKQAYEFIKTLPIYSDAIDV